MINSARRTRISLLLCACALLLVVATWHQPGSSNRARQRAEQKPAAVRLSGAAAQQFFEKPGEGQSLMAALTVARFGLRHEAHAPGDEKSGEGYLGMCHDQNLKAWFAQDGMTVRPTLSEKESSKAWRVAFRLKAYGYGSELTDVPPIIAQKVTGTRIEYERSSNPKSKIESPKLVEWYENRAEGIEQGFTLNDRPGRQTNVADREWLRVSLTVSGDLRPEVKDNGEAIQFADNSGKGRISYSKLIAHDADGKQLSTRMAAGKQDCREIVLLVDDKTARYPIVIDPIVASLSTKLDAGSDPAVGRQADARFGFSVAISGGYAVVGAWREDGPGAADRGAVYYFSESNSGTWTHYGVRVGDAAGDQCGWAVAMYDSVVYGCPGANNGAGRAFVVDLFGSGGVLELVPLSGTVKAGDRYGTSVANLFDENLIVGAPFNANGGAVHTFVLTRNFTITTRYFLTGSSIPGGYLEFGSSVAADSVGYTSEFVVGAPGSASRAGKAAIFRNPAAPSLLAHLVSNDGAAGDNFGDSVALYKGTAVVGAWGNDQKATDAGAAYVYVADRNTGNWSQQQKLMASDGSANDYFSNHAVAIDGNTIVIGAYAHDDLNAHPVNTSDDRGAAYIFTRSGTVWTEQAMLAGDNSAGDNFGISVGITSIDNNVLVGARSSTASGVAKAGAAYLYHLDCVPPYPGDVTAYDGRNFRNDPFCPGESVTLELGATVDSWSYQWRKDAVNISGATKGVLAINNLSAADAGSYDVVVSNACGTEIAGAKSLAIHSFGLQPASQNFGVAGSTGIVNVTSTGSSCSWSAVSNASFITINSGASGTGNGTLGFTVAANPNPGQRTGTITIAGLTFTITQDGTNCAYAIAPTSQTLDANASTNTVTVTTNAGCNWTATSNDPSFISINSGATGSGNGTVTYTVAANPGTMQRTGTLTVAGQTVTITQGAGATLGNISTRLPVQTGDNVLIGGFIVTGTQPKKVLIRAIGPSTGISGALGDPKLDLFAGQTLLESNDNWVDSPNKQAIIDTTIPPPSNLESAIVRTLPANASAYTAVVSGADGGTGIGLVEVYDLDRSVDSKLANISTRGLVQTNNNVMIGGFIVLGSSSQKVLIRAIGSSSGVPGALGDPTLELRDKDGNLLQADDNWRTGGQEQEIIATTIPPADDRESALIRTVPPGNYTAIVRGVNDMTGVALVEVYALN